jgi:1-deoxy-D-xylulose-5-phosphate reductoisomerase
VAEVRRGVTLLGATGSVGTQTLDVLRAHAGAFRLVGVAARSRAEDLACAVREMRPEVAGLAETAAVTPSLRDACREAGTDLLVGAEATVAVARQAGGDVVVAAVVGAAGLPATAAAVARGATVALANKESLVVAGEALTAMARRSGAVLLPVDSEHAAIHQCLRAGRAGEVRRLILTASGGPFRTRPAATFSGITVEDALRHPTWKMGAKITVDSATLMNKGLEIIEAHWLFGVPGDCIEVVIHPQSIVHSLVEFRDGNLLAQLNTPDMRDPIRYCLSYPERWEVGGGPFDLAAASPLEFERPDEERFPSLRIARAALAAGGGAPAVLNAANEVAVAAFLSRRIGFQAIPRVVEAALASAGDRGAASLHEALEADAAGREAASRAVAGAAGRS